MSRSLSRRNRDKLARAKGYDLHAMKRKGTQITIDLSTKTTKTKAEILRQNKYRKLDLSNYCGDDRAFIVNIPLKVDISLAFLEILP